MSQKELAKRFADGARTGKVLNVFIDGDRIYSYGYHFTIAERVNDKTFRVTTCKYSQSTSRQTRIILNMLIGAGKKIINEDLR